MNVFRVLFLLLSYTMSFDRFLLQIMNSLVYEYPPLQFGVLLRRYKRFFADIRLDSGEEIVAHCPNTGSMTGLCEIGAPVMVSPSNNPQRKLAYTWEMISVGGRWIGVNTGLPNKVVAKGLEQRLFPELGEYEEVRSEVKYGVDGRSRIDFLLSGGAKPIYVEVKNTTWKDGDDLVRFPDTETTRGQKHLREAMHVMPEAQAVMLYFINRDDVTRFAPGDDRDPTYGKLLRQGVAEGLQILPCRFRISPAGVEYLGLAELVDVPSPQPSPK
jgi:sugar fermentation stimulation protein A